MTFSRTQLAQFAQRLDTRYRALVAEVRDELANSASQQYVELLNREPADIGDQSVADELADLNLTIIDRHVRELRDIEAAKSRLKERAFGVCVDCGDDVAFERLLAYPTAKRCVACQQQRERTYAQGGTPTL
jgi:DnaK suppressor protein